MDVLLITGRAARRAPHESLARAHEHARALAAAGHRVRLMCLLTVHEPPLPQAPAGVERTELRAAVPDFRSVLGRLSDLAAERALMAALRADAPEVVHLFACGGATSASLGWLAERLGVAHVAEVDLAEALCHRGTLIDETGASCSSYEDPRRCTACCLTAGADALGGVGAWLGRSLRWAGDASPFPNATVFENRLDTIVGSLLIPQAIVVRNESERDVWIRLGVPKRVLRVLERGDPEEWIEVYRAAQSATVT